MTVPFLDLTNQYQQLSAEIDAVISDVLKDGRFIGGEVVANFNRDFSQYLDVKHCISCGNATDALEIALRALEIGSGDEVLVPDLTQISAAEAVSLVGASPVFIDVHSEHYTIDPAKISDKVTTKTKAIIPVHLYGLPAPMDEIMSLASTYNLSVIEDCAQAHGASFQGKKVGAIGDIGVFSFYPTKNLGAYGDGGAMVTNDPELAAACQMIADHGQSDKDKHIRLGRNSRLDTLQAAILSRKLPYLDAWNDRRRSTAELYRKLLPEAPITLPTVPNYAAHVYHLYVIQADHRDALKEYLEEKGIVTAIHYPYTISRTEVYASHQSSTAVNTAHDLTGRILSLPIYPEITPKQVECVCSNILGFYGSH
ncbi:MAG: DegT/DnrJ/EryC1/StrS family aminotransferase [Cyclobacteriaceae bacterium]